MILDTLKQFKPYSISPGYHSDMILYGTESTDELIPHTTYPYQHDTAKAIQGIVHSHYQHDFVFVFIHEHSLLFQITHQNKIEAYLEYSFHEHRFIMATINEESDSLYRLLLTAINYLYNQYQIEEFADIYENWRHIDMSQHEHGQQWDANEYKYVLHIANRLIELVKEMMNQPDCFLSLHYDSVEEFMQHQHITFNTQSLCETFLFQKDPQNLLLDLQSQEKFYESLSTASYTILDINPLYSDQEKQKLPLFLQESIKDNEHLYMQNRHFLDQNDFDLIKSFQRGKTWSCLYYGPSGTGKTTKLLCVAGALGLPSLKMVGSRSIDESTLFGKYVLRNGEIIHAHPLFRFAESMNIGYAGTNEMNLSHKSRIQNKIKISQLPIDKMAQIIVKETDIDLKTATQMASLLDAFNNVIINEGNETTQRIDLRTLLNWANKTVDLDGDVLRASLVTIISELAEEDDEILNLEDVRQILSTNGAASSVMSLIVHEFVEQEA